MVQPGPRATVFFGQNGQGKTNLLESAYYATELRSFRTKNRAEIDRWGEPQARVAADVSSAGPRPAHRRRDDPHRKQVRVDGKVVQRQSPALRGVGVVVFLPEDLLLPRAPPAARRSFIDRAVYSANRVFFAEAVAYQKVLKNRNAVLRRPSADPSLLATYDEQTARTGARLVMRRRALVAALAPRVRGSVRGPARRHRRGDPLPQPPRGGGCRQRGGGPGGAALGVWNAHGRWTCAGGSPGSAPTPTTSR